MLKSLEYCDVATALALLDAGYSLRQAPSFLLELLSFEFLYHGVALLLFCVTAALDLKTSFSALALDSFNLWDVTATPYRFEKFDAMVTHILLVSLFLVDCWNGDSFLLLIATVNISAPVDD